MSFPGRIVLVENRLDRYADRLESAVQDGVTLAANNTVRRSRPLTPFRTGHLRGAIAVEIGRLIARVFWLAAYAAYQEFGTRRGVRAKRFAQTSAETEGRALVAFLTAAASRI